MSTLIEQVEAGMVDMPTRDASEFPELVRQVVAGDVTEPEDIATRLDAMAKTAMDLDEAMRALKARQEAAAVYATEAEVKSTLHAASTAIHGAELAFSRDQVIAGQAHAEYLQTLRHQQRVAQAQLAEIETARVFLMDNAPERRAVWRMAVDQRGKAIRKRDGAKDLLARNQKTLQDAEGLDPHRPAAEWAEHLEHLRAGVRGNEASLCEAEQQLAACERAVEDGKAAMLEP